MAEVNPLWHLSACKPGFSQLFSGLRHPPAKQGKIQQSGKGIMLGLFWNVLGKAWTELQSPWILPEFLSTTEAGTKKEVAPPCVVPAAGTKAAAGTRWALFSLGSPQ